MREEDALYDGQDEDFWAEITPAYESDGEVVLKGRLAEPCVRSRSVKQSGFLVADRKYSRGFREIPVGSEAWHGWLLQVVLGVEMRYRGREVSSRRVWKGHGEDIEIETKTKARQRYSRLVD